MPMLLQWVLAKAREEGWVVSLFASLMGEKLYTKLGFTRVGTAHVQVEGEDEALDVPAIVKDWKW